VNLATIIGKIHQSESIAVAENATLTSVKMVDNWMLIEYPTVYCF
jgi:hypothetical protein